MSGTTKSLLIVLAAGGGCVVFLALLVVALGMVAIFALTRGPMLTSFLHQQPPDLPASGTWLNSDGPVSLAELKGNVVWLEFSFLH